MAITIDSYGYYAYTTLGGTQIVVAASDFNNRGDYSAAATYAVGDVQTYLGALYYCLAANTGVAPDGNVSAYWSTMVLYEAGTATVDCCVLGTNALVLAQHAYDIASIGTNVGTNAYDLAAAAYILASDGTNFGADEAYSLAAIGTNVGSNAIDLAIVAQFTANSAYSGANSAFSIAVIGTNVGTTAYNLADSAFSGANAAYALAIIGTNSGGGDPTAAYNLAAIGTDVGTNAYNLAQSAFSGANSAFSIAVAGTDAAIAAQFTADSAFSGANSAFNLATIGTNVGTNAYNLAALAYALASAGTTVTAADAYALAAIGTNVGTNAFNLAQSAFSGANSAYSIAVDGTNAAASAQFTADSAFSGANAAYALAVIGTNSGGGGDGPLAQEAYNLANIGTNVGTNAYNLATTGSNLAYLAFTVAGTSAARDANGNLYTDSASGDPPASMTNGLYMVEGVAPTTMPENTVGVWVADLNGSNTQASLFLQVENGTQHVLGGRWGINTLDPQSTLDVNGDILAKTYETADSAILVFDQDSATVTSNDLPFPDTANVVLVAAGTVNTVSNVRAGAEYTLVPTGDVILTPSSSIVIRGNMPLLLATSESVKVVGRTPTAISVIGVTT